MPLINDFHAELQDRGKCSDCLVHSRQYCPYQDRWSLASEVFDVNSQEESALQPMVSHPRGPTVQNSTVCHEIVHRSHSGARLQ